jgi:hypothetical protein
MNPAPLVTSTDGDMSRRLPVHLQKKLVTGMRRRKCFRINRFRGFPGVTETPHRAQQLVCRPRWDFTL